MSLWDYISASDPMTLLESVGFLDWGVWFLIAVALVLLYRHGVLSYGAHKKGWESLALFFVWMIIAQKDTTNNFTSIIWLFLLLASVELVITSYALHRTPYLTFNVGLWLGVLSLVHPAYLFIAPFIYIQLREIRLTSPQHTSAYILGILTAWWLMLLLMAAPSIDGISTFLLRHTQGIIDVRVLPREIWVPAGLYTVLLLFMTTKTASCFGRAINRHRWAIVTHLWLAWLFDAIWIAYGGSVHAFFVASLFFTSASFTFLTGRGEGTLFTKLFVLLLTLAVIVTTLIIH